MSSPVTTARCLVAAAAVCLAAGAAFAETEVERLHEVFRLYTAWQYEEFPSMAMARGDYTHADRIADVGLDAVARRHDERRAFLIRLRSVDRGELAVPERLNWDLFELKLLDAIDGHEYRMFLVPISARWGVHAQVHVLGGGAGFEPGGGMGQQVSQ